jgi:GT2 family glycosyltransferase
VRDQSYAGEITPTGDSPLPELGIVVPTRDRPQELARCLDALQRQQTSRPIEILVVDDSTTETDLRLPPGERHVRVLRSRGRGPAAARNVGWRASRADVILFTDDDTIPDRAWAEAARAALDEHPDAVGIEGPTSSPRYDPLRAHSVSNCQAGAFFTCNLGMRRWALDALGGFHEGFPFAHCEDRDLGFRALSLGPFLYEPEMRVTHPPRQASARQLVARARFAPSVALLYARHPERYPKPRFLPTLLRPAAAYLQHWRTIGRGDLPVLRQRPSRALRLAGIAIAGTVVSIAEMARYGRAGQVDAAERLD